MSSRQVEVQSVSAEQNRNDNDLNHVSSTTDDLLIIKGNYKFNILAATNLT